MKKEHDAESCRATREGRGRVTQRRRQYAAAGNGGGGGGEGPGGGVLPKSEECLWPS